MNNWKQRATTAAEAVYREFLETVVEKHVLEDRVSQEFSPLWVLSDKKLKAIAAGQEKHPRPVRLMALSGKGGWSDDAEKRVRYLRNTNITLLDHLLSVVRGALMLAALDWLARNPDMDEDFLYRKLHLIAALAFMHDIDKDLNLGGRIHSVDDVNDAQVAERMQRYGLDKYLQRAGIELTPGQLLYLIDKVEAQQANRRLPDVLPPAYADGTLPLFVRLADKLDGIFLDADPEKLSDQKGIGGVLKRLAEDRSCIRSEELRQLFTNGRVVDIYDPHHPFLLDTLQQQLALYSRELVGAPPFLEIHHDGRLLVLLYEEQADDVIEQAIASVCASLSFSLKIHIETSGEPKLLNEQPNHKRLSGYLINEAKHSDILNIFTFKSKEIGAVFEPFSEHMGEYGISPNLKDKYEQSKSVSLYFSDKDIQGSAKVWLRHAAHAALLMNLTLNKTPKNFPNYDAREHAFLEILPEPTPDWVRKVEYGHGRRVLTALWATTLASENVELKQAIWGADGLLKQWLEGTEDIPAFRQFIPSVGEQIIQAVRSYFQQRTNGSIVVMEDENIASDSSQLEYCHFTAQPMLKGQGIVVGESLGLGKLGIKASAFSGRDNRPEGLNDGSHTLISPVSLAEYSLRADLYKAVQGNKEIDMPTFLSSPTTLGLFGGLALDGDNSIRTVALRDLTSVEVGRLDDLVQYKGRCRIARFESFAGNTASQVSELYWLLQGVMRLGRPIHIFRGLPVHSRAFFYFDALPEWLGELLHEGKDREYARELRLEQIPRALERLKLVDILLRVPGLGYDICRSYANQATRFSSLCRGWCYLWDKKETRFKNINPIQMAEARQYLESEFLDYKRKDYQMNKSDKVLVEFALQATRIQSNRGSSAAMRKQLQVFELCLEFMTVQRKHGRLQTETEADRQALKLGVAGWLEDNLTRRRDVAAKSHWQTNSYKDACLEVAAFFIDTVWPEALDQRIPSLERLRNIKSIYRMAFIQSYQPKPKEKTDAEDELEPETAQGDLF